MQRLGDRSREFSTRNRSPVATQGRATFSMKFDGYQPRPSGLADDDRESPLGAPRKPSPRVNDSSVALPEPDDDGY
jgi:hypothetical protein